MVNRQNYCLFCLVMGGILLMNLASKDGGIECYLCSHTVPKLSQTDEPKCLSGDLTVLKKFVFDCSTLRLHGVNTPWCGTVSGLGGGLFRSCIQNMSEVGIMEANTCKTGLANQTVCGCDTRLCNANARSSSFSLSDSLLLILLTVTRKFYRTDLILTSTKFILREYMTAQSAIVQH